MMKTLGGFPKAVSTQHQKRCSWKYRYKDSKSPKEEGKHTQAQEEDPHTY